MTKDPKDHAGNVYPYKVSYQELIEVLKSNHFYPDSETKNGEIQSLHIEASATITIDDKVSRLKEVLHGWAVSIKKFPNEGYIKITLKK